MIAATPLPAAPSQADLFSFAFRSLLAAEWEEIDLRNGYHVAHVAASYRHLHRSARAEFNRREFRA